jgi:hypothetical protein
MLAFFTFFNWKEGRRTVCTDSGKLEKDDNASATSYELAMMPLTERAVIKVCVHLPDMHHRCFHTTVEDVELNT